MSYFLIIALVLVCVTTGLWFALAKDFDEANFNNAPDEPAPPLREGEHEK